MNLFKRKIQPEVKVIDPNPLGIGRYKVGTHEWKKENQADVFSIGNEEGYYNEGYLKGRGLVDLNPKVSLEEVFGLLAKMTSVPHLIHTQVSYAGKDTHLVEGYQDTFGAISPNESLNLDELVKRLLTSGEIVDLKEAEVKSYVINHYCGSFAGHNIILANHDILAHELHLAANTQRQIAQAVTELHNKYGDLASPIPVDVINMRYKRK